MSASAVANLRRRYQAEGVLGLVDHRQAAKRPCSARWTSGW
ncbi:hypothetical protein ACFQVA_42550 [Actinomadura keratinilytica]